LSLKNILAEGDNIDNTKLICQDIVTPMRKLFLTFSFFAVAPLIFLFTVVFTLYVSHKHTARTVLINRVAAPVDLEQTSIFASLPGNTTEITTEVGQMDARVELVRQFLERYNSPLEPYSQHIVDMADKYELDFRFIPAIAMQESNLCKRIPIGSHNCWGWGIYGDKITRFEDYTHAIETVTKSLATKYRNKGLTTPDEIMRMYTPSSNGSWANGVNFFMEELQ